jgi:predicted ATPase
LIIARSTRRLVGGLFEYRQLGPIALDGHPEAIQAWHVLKPSLLDSRFEARGDIDRQVERQCVPGLFAPDHTPSEETLGGLSPYVGRVRELELLAGCLPEAAGRVRVIDIVGEPGMGKSRLLHEFRNGLSGSRIFILSGSCWPDHQQTPYRPFIEVVRRSFGLDPGDPQADVARKLEAGLTLLGVATGQNLALLQNLLGLEPPLGSLRGLDDVLVGLRTRDLLLELVRERCRITPVIMLLEDLHWIDSASQDLLARLIADSNTGALAILHTRRPEYEPPWTGQQNAATLRLEPLAAGETSQIVQARLGVPEFGGALALLVVDRAEGNPLFAEEIANFLIEAGIVLRRATSLHYDAAAVAAALPASVQSRGTMCTAD